MKPRRLRLGLLVRAKHAPVAHHRHPWTAQFRFNLVDLVTKSLEIIGVAAINLEGHRFALTVRQQADAGLFLAGLGIAIIPPIGQGIVGALQITAGHSIQKKLVRGWRGPGLPETAFAERVAVFQPSAIGREIILGEGVPPTQPRGGCAAGGRPHHGQQGGAGTQHAGEHLPVSQFGGRGNAQSLLDAQLVGNLMDGPQAPKAFGLAQLPRTVGNAGQLGEGIGGVGDRVADGGEDRSRQMRQDSQSLGFDTGADTAGLAQEDGGVNLAALAFGDNFGDNNAYIILYLTPL